MGSVTGEATTGDAQPKEDQAPDSLSDRIDRINLISPPSTFFPRVISHHHRFLSWILTGLNWGFLSLLGSVTHSLAARLLLPPLIVGLPFLFVVLHHHSSSTPPLTISRPANFRRHSSIPATSTSDLPTPRKSPRHRPNKQTSVHVADDHGIDSITCVLIDTILVPFIPPSPHSRLPAAFRSSWPQPGA